VIGETAASRRAVRPAVRRFAIAAFALLLPIAAHALWDHLEVRRLTREVTAIRDRGEPVALRDIEPPSPKRDDEREASRLYLAAAALAVPPYQLDAQLADDLVKTEPAPFQDAARRAEFARRLGVVLARNTDAMTLLDKATALPFSAFEPGTEYSYRWSSFWTLSALSRLRSSSRCLSGDSDAAVDAAVATLRLQRIDRTRSWVRQMRPQDGGIPFILSNCPPSAPALERLHEEFVARPAADVVRELLMSERATLLSYVWSYYGVDLHAPEVVTFRKWSPAAFVTRPLFTRQLVAALQDRARLIEASRQPAAARRAAFAMSSERREASVPWAVAPMRSLPGPEIRFVLDAVATRQAAVIAVAVERYRRAHAGQLPAALTDLVPTFLDRVPEDPFDDAPIRFVRKADGYVIYGIGRDGKDDGGEIAPGPPPWSGGQPGPSKDVGVFVAAK